MIRKAIIVALTMGAAWIVWNWATNSWVLLYDEGFSTIWLSSQLVVPDVTQGTEGKDVWVPYWIALLLTLAYPTIAFIRGTLRRRRPAS